jgi:non-homologous end joining protein Ku
MQVRNVLYMAALSAGQSARTWSPSRRISLRPRKTKFDPRKFKDDYEKALKKLIRRKAKGKTIEAPKPPEKTDNVINLMDALRQSLGSRTHSARRKPRSARPRRARKAA